MDDNTTYMLADALLIALKPEAERTPADKELLTIAKGLAERVQAREV